MINHITSLKKVLEKLEVHIGCLSCGKLYDNSLMLVCGHSICTDVSKSFQTINIL